MLLTVNKQKERDYYMDSSSNQKNPKLNENKDGQAQDLSKKETAEDDSVRSARPFYLNWGWSIGLALGILLVTLLKQRGFFDSSVFHGGNPSGKYYAAEGQAYGYPFLKFEGIKVYTFPPGEGVKRGEWEIKNNTNLDIWFDNGPHWHGIFNGETMEFFITAEQLNQKEKYGGRVLRYHR